MPPEPAKLLHDALDASRDILEFTRGKTLETYSADKYLRAAVERKFEIVGEALNRLSRLDESLASRISDLPRIVGFRNLLAHGYSEVDDYVVWGIVERRLTRLVEDIESVLAALD